MGANRRGNRSAKRSDAMALAKAFPDRMREALEPLMEPYLREFEFDLTNRILTERGPEGQPLPNPAHRTAMDLYPRMMRVIGASDELVAALLVRLGMPSEAEMVQAAELYRAVQGQDAVEVYRECRRMVDWCEGPAGPPEVAAYLAEKSHANGNGVKP